jgi:hypothetical protein
MNVVGKILVFLNLLFALVVAGFLVLDFSTRINWKARAKQLEDELKVAQVNTVIHGSTLGDLNNAVRKAEDALEEAKTRLKDAEDLSKVNEVKLNQLIQDEKNSHAKTILALQESEASNKRLSEENKGLLATVQNRDSKILAQEKDITRFRNEAITNENEAKRVQSRVDQLLARNQELERTVASAKAGATAGAGGNVVQDPNRVNPPQAFVKGVIEKIDPQDRTLVQVSVGSDQGLGKNNTLEVYRLDPRPEYLGTIRIVESFHHKAIGRLMRAGGTARGPLKEGDIVASELKNN